MRFELKAKHALLISSFAYSAGFCFGYLRAQKHLSFIAFQDGGWHRPTASTDTKADGTNEQPGTATPPTTTADTRSTLVHGEQWHPGAIHQIQRQRHGPSKPVWRGSSGSGMDAGGADTNGHAPAESVG